MKDENYINIQGWMMNRLGLNGNELILFAIIYGFSQDGESEYFGSQRYIAEAMKLSLPTVNKLINKLLSKGIVIKTSESHYIAVKESLTVKPVLKKVKQGVKESLTNRSRKLNKSVKESLTNNNTNNTTNISINKFNFETELLKLGVEKQILNDFMEVRKKKKAVNSQTALNGFLREARKTTLPLNEVVRICAEKNWKGFNVSWLDGDNERPVGFID